MSKLLILAIACTVFLCSATGAPMTVRLLTSMPSPQPVGTAIGLVPRVESATRGLLVFRYSISVDGGPSHIIRDFSQQRDFVWSPPLYEHDASIRVTVRNNGTKETAQADQPFRTVTRVKGSQPVVTPTAN